MSGNSSPATDLASGSSYNASDSPPGSAPLQQQQSFKLPDFADSDFYVNPESVVLGPSIGEGAFSTVFAGRYFGDIVAVKKQTRQGKDLEKYLLRELAVLKYIRHKSMLEYIGAYNMIAKTRGQLHAVYIITEYAAGGDLLKLLLRPNTPLGWKFLIRVAMEGLGALEYLHNQELIHRDIKSSNFLLDGDWHCKLSDFGMAREVAKDGKMTICGTDEYMAPEMLFDENFSYSADMFSFGMVLLEVISRKKVGDGGFATRTPAKLFALDAETCRSCALEGCPESLLLLATQCLEYEPDQRPTAEDGRKWLSDLLTELPDEGEPPAPPLPVVEGMSELEPEPFITPPIQVTIPPLGRGNNSCLSSPLETLSLQDEKVSPGGTITLRPAVPPRPESPRPTLVRTEGAGKEESMSVLVPSKMGYLHVKNQGLGFRNWKKRWFVLKGGELICYKDGGHIEHVDLTHCTIVRGKTNRFQLVKMNSASGADDPSHQVVEEMELSVPDTGGLEAWLTVLQSGIDYAHGKGEVRNDISPLPPGDEAQGGLFTDDATTVSEWLALLKLSHLLPLFEAKGYTDLARILQRGLKRDDMDKIGIDHLLHRRFLEGVGRSPFKEKLEITVVGHRNFGDVIVFKVVAEWRAWHSKTEKLSTDFNKLHNKLRRALKDHGSPLLEHLAELPGKGKVVQNQKDPAFILMRKRALQSYLQGIANLIGQQQPYFRMLCDAVDLIPTPVSDTDYSTQLQFLPDAHAISNQA